HVAALMQEALPRGVSRRAGWLRAVRSRRRGQASSTRSAKTEPSLKVSGSVTTHPSFFPLPRAAEADHVEEQLRLDRISACRAKKCDVAVFPCATSDRAPEAEGRIGVGAISAWVGGG